MTGTELLVTSLGVALILTLGVLGGRLSVTNLPFRSLADIILLPRYLRV